MEKGMDDMETVEIMENSLEENSEYAKGHFKPMEQRVYFKECLGEFAKGVTNEITGEKVMGKEYIWFKGMKSGYEHCVEVIDNDILDALEEVRKYKNSEKCLQ